MGYHAKRSPSGAPRWSTCTASLHEEAGKPNESNEASRWGTTNHLLSSTCLETGDEPAMYAEWSCIFWHHPESESEGESLHDPHTEPDMALEISHVVPIDDEQIECANGYVNFVRELRHALDAEMHIEQAVPIDHITGESEATGTADTVLLPRTLDEIVIVDLKGGMYRVDAFSTAMEINNELVIVPVTKPNLQLAMYASGALRKFDPHGRYKHVRMIIVQPRLGHVSEHTMTIAELGETVRFLREKSKEIDISPKYAPSFETCHYCKGKSTCAEFQRIALDTVFTDQSLTEIRPVPLHEIGTVYRKLDLIELFAASIRSLVYKELTEHRKVPGVKLVQGRMGNRKWDDPERVAQILNRDFALPKKLTHVEKFVGPAKVELLAKKTKKGPAPIVNEFQWSLIQRHVTQDPGKAVVVLEEDPRPAIANPADSFSEVTSGTDSAVSESPVDTQPVDFLNLGI